MNSWQARLFNSGVRLFLRRGRWGDDERAVARRARRLFGSSFIIQKARTFGVRVEQVRGEGGVRGEWLTPAEAGPGVVLYMHGGGYVSCSPTTHRPIAAALARGAGRRVFSLDYRLAPEHRYPAALDDAVAAYEWLLGTGLPPESVSLAGDSAGGGLVLGTLLRLRDAGRALPACAVCFSPWTDLAGTGESIAGNDGRCQMFRPANIGEFASAYLGGASPLDPYASPVYADLGRLPPVLLQVGSTELLLDDSRRVHAKILETGGRSELEVYEDIFHCWQMLDGIVPEAGEALRRASLFVLTHSR